MYECGKLKKVIGNKILFRVILEQCEPAVFSFFLVRQLEEQRADEYINIMTGNWWPETD